MSVEQSFLDDIRANPDDDSPRLIFADWLDDHGDAARAEFIRLQCELAKLPEDDPRRDALRDREEELLRSNRERWLGEFADLGTCYFQRGFIEGIILEAARFLSRGSSLFQHAPVRRMHVTRAAEHIEALARCQHLAQIEELRLGDQALDDRAVSVFVRSPHLARLRILNLEHNAIGPQGANALASSPHLGNLEELNLSYPREETRIGPEGMVYLARSPYLTRLITLRV